MPINPTDVWSYEPIERTQKSKSIPVPEDKWPLWAKAIRHFAKPEDRGIGDVIRRNFGDENSERFKKWYKATFNKDCGCTGRQARWNRMYQLNK